MDDREGSPPAALPARTVLRGRYRLIGALETGRVATLYHAEVIETGRPVTIKVFHEVGRGDRERLESFRRSTRNPDLAPELPEAFVAVHACDLTEQGQLFLVTEFVLGISLADLLRRTPRLDPARALGLGTQIGEALEAALRLGHAWLPLVPADIVVDDVDDVKLLRSDVLVLGQLGLAEPLAAAEALARNPRYASPEELADLPATAPSLVYRLGVLLYELLGGSVPFEGTSPAEIRDRQLRTLPRPLRVRHRSLPASVDRLVTRMIDRDPAARPTDLSSVVKELRDAAFRLRAEPAPLVTQEASPAAVPVPRRRVVSGQARRWALAYPIILIGGALLAWSHLGSRPLPPTSVTAPAQVDSALAPPSGVGSQPPTVPLAPLLVVPPASPGTSSAIDAGRGPAPSSVESPRPPAAPADPTPGSRDATARAGDAAPSARGAPSPDSGSVSGAMVPGQVPAATGGQPSPPPAPVRAAASPESPPGAARTVPSESPRPGDPTAIIEWLVRESPRLGSP